MGNLDLELRALSIYRATFGMGGLAGKLLDESEPDITGAPLSNNGEFA